MMKTKICSKCSQELPATAEYFYKEAKGKDGLRGDCKMCREETRRKWATQNRERLAKNQREWRKRNHDHWIEWQRADWEKNREHYNRLRREKLREYKLSGDLRYTKRLDAMKRWYEKNKGTEKIRKHQRAWRKRLAELRRTVPYYAIRNRLRSRLAHALRSDCVKAAKTAELVGCDYHFFKKYFFSLFTDDMTITDFMNGKIHIDHRMPIASFDLTTEKEQKKAFHYTNIQPLWAADNLHKNSKVVIT